VLLGKARWIEASMTCLCCKELCRAVHVYLRTREQDVKVEEIATLESLQDAAQFLGGDLQGCVCKHLDCREIGPIGQQRAVWTTCSSSAKSSLIVRSRSRGPR